jgi:cytochrome c-type biogenesis protein CcmH/NrfG
LTDDHRPRVLLPALLALLLCAAPGAARGQDSLPAALAQAQALMAAGRIDEAIHAADVYTQHHGRDVRGFLTLGDAYMLKMPSGRYRAARAYEQAQQLAPRDPLPPFKIAQAGLRLGGDDGESMALRGLERVLELDPFYPEAWDDWLTLFRNTGSRGRMRRRLAPFAANPVIKSRIALLDIEDEHYADADRLLDSALATDSANPAWLALRAQSAFEAGDTLTGWTFYRRALAHADRDSTDVLWHQVVGIAWPYEVQLWAAGVAPAKKGAWLESFWARRNPDLFAGVNHRVAEHFARLRYARKHYALLHPLISYYHSQIARAMNLEPSAGEREYYQRCEMYEVMPAPHLHPPYAGMECGVDEGCVARSMGVPTPGVSEPSDRANILLDPWSILTSAERNQVDGLARNLGKASPIPAGLAQALFSPLNLDLRSIDSVAARVGYNLATGLDDRGVMYLRFGPPDRQYVGGRNTANPECSIPDVERWGYDLYGEVRFARPSAFSRGERTVPDMVFRAMNQQQFATVRTGLTRDDSSEPAPLEFGIWTAQFADTAAPGRTDVVVVSTRGEVAASLDAVARPGTPRIGATGVVTVPSVPGPRVLVAQARDSGVLGRQTLALTVRDFTPQPAVSGLLLAPAWAGPTPDRATMLAHLQHTLLFPAGSTVRAYAEVYGLREEAGAVRYEAAYELLRSDHPERDIGRATWPGATRLEFRRERPAAASGTEVETLDIVPAQVPPGKYLLRVSITDLVTGRSAGHGSIAFVVR